MSTVDILSIIKESKEFDLKEYEGMKKIFEFLYGFKENYADILDKFENSTVRFCDYYEENFSSDELIKYFKDNYKNKDIDEQYNYFLVYSVFKKCRYLLESMVLFEPSSVLEDFCDEIDDTYSLINEFYTYNKLSEREELGFDNHKYKLLFSGFSLEDVKSLDKKTTKILVEKLNDFLLELDKLPGAEGIDHVREKYNIPLLRIRLGDDYRICFFRKKGVTIVLGVEFKTGKDLNYTRYDFVAKKIDSVYSEVDLLNAGELPSESEHNKVIDEIVGKLNVRHREK